MSDVTDEKNIKLNKATKPETSKPRKTRFETEMKEIKSEFSKISNRDEPFSVKGRVMLALFFIAIGLGCLWGIQYFWISLGSMILGSVLYDTGYIETAIKNITNLSK